MNSSSTSTMTRAQGPSTPLRSSQWTIASAPFNHLRPSQITNFRPGSAIPRATTLLKPQPVKVSASSSRSAIPQTRIPQGSHPNGPSHASRFVSRHLPNPKPQPTTVIPGAAVQSTVMDTKLCHTLETAFKVFHDRFQKDLRDFQTVCTRFVVRETQEKDRWHNLYLQVAKERDQARQELKDSQSQPMKAVSPPVPSRRVHKRSRDSYDEMQDLVTDAAPSSVNDTAQSRPIRNLRTSSTSPSPPLPSPSPIPTSATTSIGHIPTISHSPFASPSPTLAPSSSTSSTDGSDKAVTNHMIMRFYDFGPAQSLDDSAPEPKRRKSLDLGEPSPSSSNLPPRSRTQSPKRVLCTMTPIPMETTIKREPEEMEGILGVEFEHVDIMYVRRGSSLVCRACSLSKPRPDSPSPIEPTSFSVMTSWDDLKYHCVKQHPAECADVARLHPAEIFELRRRIYASS